jgi:hypothetical protein
MTRGEQLKHAISFALIGASRVVRGMWKTLTDEERWAVASRTSISSRSTATRGDWTKRSRSTRSKARIHRRQASRKLTKRKMTLKGPKR